LGLWLQAQVRNDLSFQLVPMQSRIVRFARLSIPIYDELAIDLYHLICALYFVREGTETKEKRVAIKSPMLG
jgi:hypothetical protein